MSAALANPALAALGPPSAVALSRLDRANERILQFPQVAIATEHLLHGGMYARTIRLGPGVVMMGSLIRLATTLIVHGDCSVIAGDEKIDLSGYNILPGCAGRKQLFLTRSSVEMTMLFPTQATNVTEAENEVFVEADQLMSRKDGSGDQVRVTGQ